MCGCKVIALKSNMSDAMMTLYKPFCTFQETLNLEDNHIAPDAELYQTTITTLSLNKYIPLIKVVFDDKKFKKDKHRRARKNERGGAGIDAKQTNEKIVKASSIR